MKKIGISLFVAFTLGFASPQSLANISDLKESIVLLMERQDAIIEKIDDVFKKQEDVMKVVEKLSKKIDEQEKKAKEIEEKTEKRLKENERRFGESIEENQKKFEEMGNDINILNSAIQEQMQIEAEGEKQVITANEINLIIRGEIKNEIVKLQNDLRDIQSKLKEKEKSENAIVEINKIGAKKERSIEERLRRLERANSKGIVSQGKEDILISDEEIKNGLDWLNYKTEILSKQLKECCSKKDGEEIFFDFELK